MEKFEKLKIAARYFLIGMAASDARYNKCIDALELMLDVTKKSVRNGGEPEAIHPLSIFHHARTYHKDLTDPVSVYILTFLHDLGEDYALSVESVEKTFGSKVAESFDVISKNVGDKKKDPAIYLPNCFKDELVSVVKPIDRNSNLSTMIGVFKPERLKRYVNETRCEYIPRFKDARRLFAHQETIYENLKLQIENQLNLLEYIISQNYEKVEDVNG